MNDIFNHMKSHNLRACISQVFSLEEIGQAQELMERNEAKGKLVVMFC
jgi:NADPH:quinone reductase-like Zn-dependent oxidoreductase